MSSTERLALALGWFSIGLGLAEVLAPRAMARAIGAPQTRKSDGLIRSMGAREIATGVGVLSRPSSAGPMWGRVAGDAVDLSFLGATGMRGPHPGRAMAAAAAVLGVTALDVLCAASLSGRGQSSSARTVRIKQAVTIKRPIEEVYGYWRNFENLPRFMAHLESVDPTPGNRSHWVARGPAGIAVRWNAEMTADQENRLLAWRTTESSDIQHEGSVRFEHAPGGRGTEVHVELEYRQPAGRLGAALAWMLGEDPKAQLRDDLRHLRQLLEAGEIPSSDAPGFWGAAQPSANAEQRSQTGAAR